MTQDGLMSGVGNKGGIYTIKTPPATTDVVVTKVSQFQYALSGANFGVDFNPAADRLRVISDNGQNLRHNLNDHSTIQNLNLTTPPIEGTTKGVSAAAYTNTDLSAATLVDINTTTDQIVLQSPANNGTLAPTGSLGIDAGINAGMDIYSTLSGGKTVDNAAFATLTPYGASTPSLYSINVFTGQATSIGQFPRAERDEARLGKQVVQRDALPTARAVGEGREDRVRRDVPADLGGGDQARLGHLGVPVADEQSYGHFGGVRLLLRRGLPLLPAAPPRCLEQVHARRADGSQQAAVRAGACPPAPPGPRLPRRSRTASRRLLLPLRRPWPCSFPPATLGRHVPASYPNQSASRACYSSCTGSP
ncbi:hypothetical protein GCM10022295_28010 [Streptomyces osmaniensis]|uniref:DUF4394 domain-containing protein n=1 Tax=Streptomyces osmaniensis TaxID=593134 RepID=A0ABP6W5B1_9ACTN